MGGKERKGKERKREEMKRVRKGKSQNGRPEVLRIGGTSFERLGEYFASQFQKSLTRLCFR